jgi:hypothetical protein
MVMLIQCLIDFNSNKITNNLNFVFFILVNSISAKLFDINDNDVHKVV